MCWSIISTTSRICKAPARRLSITTRRQSKRRCSPNCRSNLPQCPGGVGLTTAMTMLQSGWIIVGSTPSTDGTTKTKGAGCLIVLDTNGKFVNAISGPAYQRSVGQYGGDRQRRDGDFVRQQWPDLMFPALRSSIRRPASLRSVNKATVLRIELSIPGRQAACRHKPDGDCRRVKRAFGQGRLSDRPDRSGARAGRQNALCVGRRQ